MLTKETKARVSDYFDTESLLDVLGLTTDLLVEVFEDEIEEKMDEINEIMGYEEDGDE